jgi:type I restriction enzyme S subunit
MKLLEHFHKLSIYPKNAKELKGLILQLAVKGKLTTEWRKNNPEVESASVLLERIIEYNSEQLILKKRKVKKTIINNVPNLVSPPKWIHARNNELFSLQKGKNPKDLSESVSKYPYLDIEALDRGNIRRYSNDEKASRCTENEILVVCDGSRSGLVLNGKDGIVGSTLAVIETPPFIQHFVRLLFLEDFQRANSSMKGAAIPHLDTKFLLENTIGLPPLEEQNAIVSIVEKLFKEVEQLEQLTVERIQLKEKFAISALNQINIGDTSKEWAFLQQHFTSFFNEESNIKKLRETILQLAVQGKLTEHWRKANPKLIEAKNSAKELLEQIKKEKALRQAQGTLKKEKPLPPITKDEIPYKLPDGWVWCRLTEVVDVGTGSTPSKTNLSYYEGGTIPWYTSSATNDRYAKVQDIMITQKALDKTNCKIFPKGSLIIALYGQGKTRGQISELIVPGATNQAIAGMVFYESSVVIKQYLKYFFQKIYHEIRLLAEGGAQPNLNVGKIKGTFIPIPPIPELEAIVEKVNSLMALCDSLEQEVKQSKDEVEKLMKAVLREVFEGEKECVNE